ncbi:hypothetical protein T484DRAFT_1816911 [Baffinella frigidus]|nr:hypothetical protein T484DRAFT_1816911 [Cryptophyta sp. CCMP2293]
MNLGLFAAIVMYDTFSPGGISNEGWVSSTLIVFAASALVAFYILHQYLVLGMVSLMVFAFPQAPPYFSSAVAFGVVCPGVLAVMYRVCKRWAAFKATTTPESLWRLL